jgi:hypothetical protein
VKAQNFLWKEKALGTILFPTLGTTSLIPKGAAATTTAVAAKGW